jgi:hypothetical protein
MAYLGSDQLPMASQGQAGSDDQARIPRAARGNVVQRLLSSGIRAWIPLWRGWAAAKPRSQVSNAG